MVKKIVIVGGGITGISVLRNLFTRKGEVEEEMELTLIKRENSGWVSTCGLPFALRGWYEIKKTEINDPQFFLDQGVDFKTETEVARLNLEDNKVTLKTGDVISYDYLVIATGRKPSVPDAVAETELEGVYTFNNEVDAVKIEAAMNAEGAKNGFVRGRGIIGLQAAVAFSTKGLKTTVLGGPPSLLPSGLDPDMGDMVKEWLEQQGIRLLLERKEIVAVKGDGGRVKSVVIGTGGNEEEIPADVVVIARGMNPNVALAQDAGVEIGEARGIVTDSAMHVKKGRGYLNNVYSLGDCTEVVDGITYRPRLSQLASTAVVQAKVVADNIFSDISGQPGAYSACEPCLSPVAADIGGLLVGSLGVTSEAASRAGIKIISGKATKSTKARYFPGSKSITAKLIFDAYTEKLIGAQVVSEATVAERINELELAIRAGMTAKEICNIERSYDPSLALLKDVTIDAAEGALGRGEAVY
ncbi:Coenzyme A disulfide reductase [ANME-1 cluster archaeon GoMg2]|nr:Coenzyme A disulfide reductase [ANME-1 cluster archaeon GoMg2]